MLIDKQNNHTTHSLLTFWLWTHRPMAEVTSNSVLGVKVGTKVGTVEVVGSWIAPSCHARPFWGIFVVVGDLAQLVERLVRNQ